MLTPESRCTPVVGRGVHAVLPEGLAENPQKLGKNPNFYQKNPHKNPSPLNDFLGVINGVAIGKYKRLLAYTFRRINWSNGLDLPGLVFTASH